MYKDHTEFKFIWKTLTVFCRLSSIRYSLRELTYISPAVIAIILLLVTFIFSILTLQNFGRGLKESRKLHGILNPLPRG